MHTWHNWKFDLRSGKCIVGGDNVQTYPTEIRNGYIYVDSRPPNKEVIKANLLDGLHIAFEKRQYGRISRELTRMMFHNIDPCIAILHAIAWSFERFEFGMTHAYAGCSDWLTMYDSIDDTEEDAQEKRIICLTEALDHMHFVTKNILFQNKSSLMIQKIFWTQ